MAKQRFADEDMKQLIKDINSGALTVEEQTAVDVAIFNDAIVSEFEPFTINEFGEVVREEKKNVSSVSREELDRIKREMGYARNSEVSPEM